MKRIPEPELMNTHKQVKAYSEADFSESDKSVLWSLLELVHEKDLVIDESMLIIDMGCGPGNIAENIALKWPEAKVIGIDGSIEMLLVAKQREKILRQSHNSLNLSYSHFDISDLAEDRSNMNLKANVIVSNSVLHHLHDPSVFWKALKRISKPGSITFHRDLRRPNSYKDSIELQRKYLPSSPLILVQDYLASLQASFTVEEVKSQLKQANLPNFKVVEVDDRYLEITGIL